MDQIDGFDIPHRIVPASRREDLSSLIRTQHDRGRLSDLIYQNYSKFFIASLPVRLDARSLIVAAVAHHPSRVPFVSKGRRFFLRVAPSYVGYFDAIRAVRDRLKSLLAPAGSRIALAKVPQKTLAVRSGLAVYGRNNIAYVNGLGSYHMLVSFYSDRPAAEDVWLEPRTLDRCRRCRACLKACPTGAIRPDAFPISQERCLTFYAGYSGPQELPAWLDPALVENLVGCEKCQVICPENLAFRAVEFEQEGFSAEETAVLLENRPPADIPPGLAAKLDRLGLVEFFGVRQCLEMMSRRLALFLPRVESGAIPSEPAEPF